VKVILNIDGPHSGAYSREVAEAVAEGIRVLNHASTGPASGLEYASAVDSILRHLQSAAYRLPPLLHQLAGWLQWLYNEGRLSDDRGRDPGTVLAGTLSHLAEGITYASRLSGVLREAGEATSHLQTLEATGA